ncbi:MAG TPA: urea ABC transporter substrate-binding protein, partial [Curvibacter sp.]|nr:urea ABC transporter substrate-binding protein [Curvibacter sp.]
MQRRHTLKALAVATAISTLGFAAHAQSGGTIKVGVLHSLSGTMAISETVLKDTVLMAIDEINAKGGVNGKKIELITRDDNANPGDAVRMAEELVSREKVDVLAG